MIHKRTLKVSFQLREINGTNTFNQRQLNYLEGRTTESQTHTYTRKNMQTENVPS